MSQPISSGSSELGSPKRCVCAHAAAGRCSASVAACRCSESASKTRPASTAQHTGYQIRHGQTTTTAPVTEALPDGLGYVEGPVLGIYLHGLFERPDMLEALFGASPHRSLDVAFDELAEAV